MKLKNLFLIITLSSILFSCSSDSDEAASEPDLQGDLKINTIDATKVSFDFDGNLIDLINSGYGYGIRKEGESVFTKIPFSIGETIANDLVPAQQYELAILLNENIFENKLVAFSTPPFDSIQDVNSKINPGLNTFYSEKGFAHSLKTDVFNTDANLVFFLVDEEDESKKIELTHTYLDGAINFTIPEVAVSDEPYEEFKKYHLAYQLDGKEIIKIDGFDVGTNFTFFVFNPTPVITEVESIKTENCKGNNSYRLRLKGHLFSSWPFEQQVYYNFLTSTAVITRDDDNTKIILEEETLDCIQYNRFFVKEEASVAFSFIKLHTDKNIIIKYPESTIENAKFTTGNYKIKITFNRGVDDFYETNEFPFTLP